MEIAFFGAAGEVGRSCIMVKGNGTKILLDAGVKLGEQTEYPQLPQEEIKDIDGIVISHAHLDHCGYLPHIYSHGYKGKTYAMKPTLELMNVLISDYMRLSSPKDVTKEGLAGMNKGSVAVEYKKEFKIKGLTITLIPAGHILGSALIKVSDGHDALVYTGDINLSKTRLLNGADLRGLTAKTLIMESTYGGENDHFKPEHDNIHDFIGSVRESIKAGGKVVVPSFAVGRSQEVLFILDDYMNSGAIPKVPIYVDGMITKAMRIHRHNVIYCRKELQSMILMSDYDPFKSENFVHVEKKSMRSTITSKDESSIIVTTSGMITGGPIMFYLKKMAGNPLNKLILVGYQAEGTLGRALQDGAKKVKVDGKELNVQMDVERYHMSAHADRKQLESLPGKINGISNIFIVHGEQTKSESLKKFFEHKYNAIVPRLGEKFTI
ncbi:MAG: MBL fold metallo-hydrolase [Candidatus Marsarchaeota archaeon]|nr:MBL fold metallo-hydrolase [Candidatus Marsarchaeota archaeon]